MVLPCSAEVQFHSDIDECSTEPPPCDAFADCTNTEGSFTCACRDGFVEDGHNGCIFDIDIGMQHEKNFCC